MNKTPVVILGLQDTGLFAGQSIGRYNIPVYGFDHNLKNPGFYSKYIKSYSGPHPYHEPEKLLQQVVGLVKKSPSRPILIGSTEGYLGFISNHREELKNWFRFVIPEAEIIQNILSKSEQFVLAGRCNMMVPDYSQVTSKADFTDYLNRYDHKKIIIKALDQTVWKTKVEKKAFIPGNYQELLRIGNSLIEKDIPFVIQKIINGDCTNNFEYNALMIDGEIIEGSVIQKLRQYPPGFGAACCTKTSKNKEIEKLGLKFVVQNKIEGFSNTEFKLDPLTGEYFFIETNARIWSQIRLSEYNGQNFLIQYYNRLADIPIKYCPVRTDKEIKWVDIFSDIVLWWRFLRKDKMSFLKWLQSLSKTKNFGMLNFRDLRPFLHEVTMINLLKSGKTTN